MEGDPEPAIGKRSSPWRKPRRRLRELLPTPSANACQPRNDGLSLGLQVAALGEKGMRLGHGNPDGVSSERGSLPS